MENIYIIEGYSSAAIEMYIEILSSETSTKESKNDAYKRLYKICNAREVSDAELAHKEFNLNASNICATAQTLIATIATKTLDNIIKKKEKGER